MREILFRGIRKDTHEWVYGFYCEYFDGKRNVPCVSVVDTHVITGALCYEVVPETVGQYTGLTDKNGNRVFEGDIVKLTINRDYIFSVDWVNDCGMYCLKCLNRHPKHNFEALDTDFTVFNGDETEIIGNIHDNADLLK